MLRALAVAARGRLVVRADRIGGKVLWRAWRVNAAVLNGAGQQVGPLTGQCGVEQGQAVLVGDGGQAGAGQAGQVGRVEVGGHAAGGLPVAPGHAGGLALGVVAVAGQRVQEGVGGRVVGLPGAAQYSRGRGEQDERGQVAVGGEAMQMPGGVGLGGQDRVELFGGQFGHHGVIEDAGGVDDRGQRVAGGDGVQRCGQLGGVAVSQAVIVTWAPSRGQTLLQFAGPGSGRARCETPAADA